jgi:hypothetical protein
MKWLMSVLVVFTLLSAAAFAVLIIADRLLGVPLPYSIPLSFAAVSVCAPLLVALAHALRRRRPIVVQPPVTRTAPLKPGHLATIARSRPRQAQGVVLLDLSSISVTKEKVA